MDELVRLVAEKTGISQDQAQKAVTTIIGFLKQRLPGPIAGELDKLIGGAGGSSTGGLAGMVGEAEGILGQFTKK